MKKRRKRRRRGEAGQRERQQVSNEKASEKCLSGSREMGHWYWTKRRQGCPVKSGIRSQHLESHAKDFMKSLGKFLNGKLCRFMS